MGIKLYDEALAKKIKNWVVQDVMILKPNEVSRLWEIQADTKDDKPLTLPLIAISRDSNVNVDIPNKRSLSADGARIGNTEDKIIKLDAIPITINYQIDIYTQHYDEGDEYLREFIFKLVNEPKMKILIPYNGSQIEHVCYVRLDSNVVDNSDVPEKKFPDQFTRWSLQIHIEDAYLFSVPLKSVGKLAGAELVVVNKLNDGTIEEVEEKIVPSDTEEEE